jgi:hypothetical protein
MNKKKKKTGMFFFKDRTDLDRSRGEKDRTAVGQEKANRGGGRGRG